MLEIMSIEPFNRLVKLAARAFYDDFTNLGTHKVKPGKTDNRGIAVVVLDALTRRQWVREEDLAKDLKLHARHLRRILRHLEEEKLIIREHRREKATSAKIYNAAVAAEVDNQQIRKNGMDKIKLRTHSYCCLDYAQIYDVIRYRVHRVKKSIRDELEYEKTIQEYMCPNCEKRYNALDALWLVSFVDEYFHCESCNGELVVESERLAAYEAGDGKHNARRCRHDYLAKMVQKVEVQLTPLMDQLSRIKDLPVPELGSLQGWEVRVNAAARAAKGDSFISSPGPVFSGAPLPFLGKTEVEVDFSGIEKKEEDAKPDAMKVLPPWLIKQGMNITQEQLGKGKLESALDSGAGTAGFTDDKKSIVELDDGKKLQNEYVKAYYAALYQRQQELAAKKQQDFLNLCASGTSDRQVGMKSKRNDVQDIEGVKWEQAPPTGSATSPHKADFNIPANASESGGDDEDDIDWEEG